MTAHPFISLKEMPVMKKQTLYYIAISVLFLFIGRLPIAAQSPDYVMTFQVPFEFQVNGKSLPAGKYIFRRDRMMPTFMQIQCPERNIWLNVHTVPSKLSKKGALPCLIFRKYAENHFLSEVRSLEYGEGYALFKSKAERKQEQIGKEKNIHVIPNGATTSN